MDAMAASIAHEIRQPLAAIVLNGETAFLSCLAGTTPDLEEARAALHSVVEDGHRANAVIVGIRFMYRKDSHGRVWLDINDLVRQVLQPLKSNCELITCRFRCI